MSTTARALGKGAPFEFEGQTYTIAPWVQDVQAEYEQYLVGRAYANLRAARREMPEAEYAEERSALRRDVDAGLYEFGRQLVWKSLDSVKNQKHLLYLCLAWAHKDNREVRVTKDLVERIAADGEKFSEAMEIMEEVNSDPKDPPPPGDAPATAP